MANELTPSEKFALARALIRKSWPYIMDTVYAITPRPSKDTQFKTMQISKGLVLSYDVAYVNQLSKEELATAIVHEVSHVLRGFFDRIVKVDNPQLYGMAADLPINHDLKKSQMWKMRSDWIYPSTFGFPDGKSTEEYYEMLKSKKNDPQVKKILQGAKSEIGCGCCGLPDSSGDDVDKEIGENGQPIGRSAAEKRGIIRQTIQAMKNEMETRGRGSLPSFFSELVDLEHKPSRIPWRDRLAYVIRNLSGPIISGGDDFSLRHPSKRSFTRRLLRPGLIDQTLDPIFIIDTSGSMSQKQMMSGIDESISVLQQMGIEEGWLCMVDAAVAMKPKRINFTDLLGEIRFLGRGGTDFGPGLRAAVNMHPRPDLIFYFTDGDGYAPRSPCPIPTVWGVIPNRHYTQRPAKWGTVVTITDDETHPDDDEASFRNPHQPPTGYPGYEEGTSDEDPDVEEYEGKEEDYSDFDDDD